MILRGLQGKQYKLEQKPFSSGGEGEIYRIVGDKDNVVKVYYKGHVSQELEEKIKYMVSRPPSSSVLNQVAWPMDAVYDSTSTFCGFVMPKLDVTSELSEVYVYPPKTGITYKQKLILAQNICVVIHEVHKAGYVFGDFNPGNIGINLNTGMVAFLDTDSYHIVIDEKANKAYRCNVCLDGYVAPELLKKCENYKRDAYANAPLPTFTMETDNFALAIHIFRLLMNGYTPFNGIKETDSVSSASPGVGNQAIKRNNYCFKPGNKPQAVAVPPLKTLPKHIQRLFRRAFVDGRDKPEKRPSAMEWHKALLAFENSLVTCSKSPAHMYIKGLKKCPWCEADDLYRTSIAPQIQQRTFANPGTPPTPPPVVTPSSGNVGTQNVSSAQLNTFRTPSKGIPAEAPSWRQRVSSAGSMEMIGRVLNIIGWLAFIGSIIYVLMTLFSGGFAQLDIMSIYRLDVEKDAIIVTVGVALVCFGSHFALSRLKTFATVLASIWSLLFGFAAATVRSTQMGYRAAWQIFGVLLLVFGSAVVFGGKLGTATRMGRQVSNDFETKIKHHYTLVEIFFIIFMAVSSFACIPMLCNFYLYYHFLQSYILVDVAVWLAPIVVFLIFFFSSVYANCGEAVENWFCASMTTYFTCLVLWLGHVGGAGAIIGWLVFAMVGALFIGFVGEEIESVISIITEASFFIFYIAGAVVDLKVMNGGVWAVGTILHWVVSAPAIILMVIAIITTLKEIIKKLKNRY